MFDLPIRTSGVEEDLDAHRREVYVRRPTSQTSNPESDPNDVVATPPGGPFGHKSFRMIDASACDLRDPIDRNRKDSITSIVSGIVMNEQYSRQMALAQQQKAAKSHETTTGCVMAKCTIFVGVFFLHMQYIDDYFLINAYFQQKSM